jgi:MFS family permease
MSAPGRPRHPHPHHLPHHHLARWQRLLLHTCVALLAATGALWLALQYSVGPGVGGLPHPAQAWALRLHGLMAFAALFVGGALAAAHVPHGWRLSRRPRWAAQRGSGIALGALGAALALTGWLLYYFAPEDLRPALGWVHSVFGAALVALLLWHRRGRTRD